MKGIRNEQPLLVIVGPTASGKSKLAVRVAHDFNGEVISADSRAVYKGLDIGTAKPTVQEQEGIPHWGIDITLPDQRFTVADFKDYANRKIEEIRNRGHLPILVGGTGLYIDAVIYNFNFPEESNNVALRTILNNLDEDELYKYCLENNIELPKNYKNRRHLVSAILRNGLENRDDNTIIAECIVVGISTEKTALEERIRRRADMIFASGAVEEARLAAEQYGWNTEAMTGNVYPIIHAYFTHELTLEEAKEKFIIRDRQLAKRQLTWFKRNRSIVWCNLDNAYTYITQQLARLNHS